MSKKKGPSGGKAANAESARGKDARKARIQAMRAEERRKERTRAYLVWGIGGLVILVLAGVVGVFVFRELGPISGVQTYSYTGAIHKEDQNLKYKENPPVGGPHNPAWQNCGVYDKPLKNVHAVHSMEHGAVWITYRPGLPKEQLDQLTELAEGDDFMLLSPYPGLPAPVVASAWNHQVTLEDAGDDRLSKFVREYKRGPQTPEPNASCSGGVNVTAG